MNSATWRQTLLRALAFLSVLAVPAAAFVLIFTLPRAPAAERIASDALAEVQEARSVRSVETLPRQTLRATCRTLNHKRSLIAFSDGVRLRVVYGHVVVLNPRRLSPRLRRSSIRREAVLAGCSNTILRLLGRRLLRSFQTLDPAFLHLRARGDDLYMIRLRGGHPFIELELRRATLEPVGIVLRDYRLYASSRMVAEKPRP